jgi:hypothetical protein
MTAIIGLVQDGVVWMAGDSSANDLENLASFSRSETKVFHNGQYLMGIAGQCRCSQVMHYVFTPPRMPSHVQGPAEVIEFMVREFIPVLRVCLEEQGVTTGEVTDPFPGNALIGVRGILLELEPDFQISSNTDPFGAAGQASPYCLGAFNATQNLIEDPIDRLWAVLDAAGAYSMAVKKPFNVERLAPDD